MKERDWRRDLPDELHPLPDDSDEDPEAGGDCRHGCNGECHVSERCGTSCHSSEVARYWEDKRLAEEFEQHVDESLALANESFPVAAETWPKE